MWMKCRVIKAVCFAGSRGLKISLFSSQKNFVSDHRPGAQGSGGMVGIGGEVYPELG